MKEKLREERKERTKAHVEHLQKLLLGHDQPLKLLLFLDSALRYFLESRVVCISDGAVDKKKITSDQKYKRRQKMIVRHEPILDGHFIEETIISRGSQAEVATVMAFGSFTKDMGGRMPEHLLS